MEGLREGVQSLQVSIENNNNDAERKVSGTITGDQKFPVITKQVAVKIEGVHTEIVLFGYIDYVLLLITQNGKMGTFLRATGEETEGIDSEPSYSVQVLLGKRDDPLLMVYARQINELMNANGNKRPLLLSINLLPAPKDKQKSIFKAIMQVLRDNKIW